MVLQQLFTKENQSKLLTLVLFGEWLKNIKSKIFLRLQQQLEQSEKKIQKENYSKNMIHQV